MPGELRNGSVIRLRVPGGCRTFGRRTVRQHPGFPGSNICARVRASAQLVSVLRVVDPLFERTVRFASLVRKAVEVPVTTGTIKKVIADRGFGFIAAEDAKEYFFHRNALDSSLDFDRLNGGEKVKFEIEQSPKGPRAAKVSAEA